MPDQESLWDAVDKYHRRIARWDGASIRTSEKVGLGRYVIDWAFNWPGEVYAFPDPIRRDATEASAIIFDEGVRVTDLELRLPQLDAADHDQGALEATLSRRFTALSNVDVQVVVARDGGDAYTPHVRPTFGGFYPGGPETALDDVYNIWTAYRKMADPDGVIE